jgi:hypothetical protein
MNQLWLPFGRILRNKKELEQKKFEQATRRRRKI